MRTARFCFDPGSGTLLWMDEPDEVWPEFAMDLRQLPVSRSLIAELASLADRYDTSLNWAYPPDPGPWREEECVRFNDAVRRAIARLREELGPQWQIRDQSIELHEDPDLDRYLADPAGFKRSPR